MRPSASSCCAIVLEEVLLEAVERDRLQEARRDDAIRVDVVAAQRERPAGDLADLLNGASPSSPRTSTTSPATAAAATIAGLISSVRPVGLPCRPLKLRFDDDAQISRPSSLIGIHRQAHRAAGAAPVEAGVDEDPIEPLALGRQPHRLRSRHDERAHVRRDVVAADDPARLRADPTAGAFVHDPTNATSIRVPAMRLAGR